MEPRPLRFILIIGPFPTEMAADFFISLNLVPPSWFCSFRCFSLPAQKKIFPCLFLFPVISLLLGREMAFFVIHMLEPAPLPSLDVSSQFVYGSFPWSLTFSCQPNEAPSFPANDIYKLSFPSSTSVRCRADRSSLAPLFSVRSLGVSGVPFPFSPNAEPKSRSRIQLAVPVRGNGPARWCPL